MSKIVKIYGPPGTGKTTTLLNNIESALDAGVAPEEIAFISFTHKAVNEAKARVAARFGDDVAKRCVNFSTLHKFVTVQSKLDNVKCFTLPDYQKLEAALKTRKMMPTTASLAWIKEKHADGRIEFDYYFPYQMAMLARAKNTNVVDEIMEHNATMGKTMPASYASFALRLTSSIEAWKSKYGFMDFQDSIDKFNDEGHMWCDFFKVIIIDEAQDFNPTQWECIEHLRGKCEIMYIAGDDDQAIYRFSGVDVANFINFKADEEITLEVSYRLPLSIFEKTQSYIGKVTNRVAKGFLPNTGNVQGKAKRVSHCDGTLVKMLAKASLLKGSVMVIAPWKAPVKQLEAELFDFCARKKIAVPTNITFSTIYKQKGGEAETVVVLNNLSPAGKKTAAAHPEDHKRLMYVAMTRAKANLLWVGDFDLKSR